MESYKIRIMNDSGDDLITVATQEELVGNLKAQIDAGRWAFAPDGSLINDKVLNDDPLLGPGEYIVADRIAGG